MSAGAGVPPSFASFTFANRGEPSPRTPGSAGNSPWSSFLRSSPGLWTTGVRSNSLPPTPSELRSSLGREENPFSAAFSVNALPSAHLDLDAAGDNEQEGEDPATDDDPVGRGNVRGGKKRAHSLPAEDASTEQRLGAGEKEVQAPPSKRPAFAAGAFGGEVLQRPASEHRMSFNSISDHTSGSDGTKPTPSTSVEPSPKASLFDQLNASMPSDRSTHNYYQPAPRPFAYHGDASLGSHPPAVASPPLLRPPPYAAHPTFSLDTYSLQRSSPGPLPSPPVPQAAQEHRRSSAQPRATLATSTETAATRPPPPTQALPPHNPVPQPPPASPSAITVVPGPKKRGRKPKDPNAPVDQEQAAKARLSALERNRIAASKSRAKKKEKAANAESAVTDLSHSNAQLQATALALRAELLALRQQIDYEHPDQSRCTCEHIKGYLHREATGGGIPTLDRLAGETLSRDYATAVDLGPEPREFDGVARSESGEVEEEMEGPAPRSAVVQAPPVEGRIAIPIRRSVR